MTPPPPSRWQEIRTLLTDLLAWLDATQEWVASTAPRAAEQPGGEHGERDLEVDGPGLPLRSGPESESEMEMTPQPDLFALLAAMTALRQDVKLQTRSARSDREQAAQTLDQLSTVVADLTPASPPDDAPPDQVAVDALVDLHDALSRADRQGRRLMTEMATALRDWGQSAIPQAGQTGLPAGSGASEPSDPSTAQMPDTRHRRWFKRWRRDPMPSPAPAAVPRDEEGAPAAIALRQIRQEATQMADRLDGLRVGYELGISRLERLLADCGIDPIDCQGQPVDAERMEVVQVVTESRQPEGTVVDEVRRGYVRHGQVYRFAQVVAARRPSSDAQVASPEDTNPREEGD